MRGVKWVTGAALLSVALVACGAADNTATSVTDDTSVSEAPAATEENASTPDATTPKFGQTVEFSDGSTLTCATPVAFKRDQYAAGGESFRTFLKVRCKFTNKSGQRFDPTLTIQRMSAGGEEGDQVYQDGLGTPENPVLNGKSVTWTNGFGVKNKKDVQVTVALGLLDYEDITFS